MTERELNKLADKIAERLWQRQNQESEWLTIEQAAQMMGVAVSTVRDHKDEIGYSKKGKRIYFKERSVKSYISGK